MTLRWLKSTKALIFTPLTILLLVAVACGASATATPRAAEVAPGAKATRVPAAEVGTRVPAATTISVEVFPANTPRPVVGVVPRPAATRTPAPDVVGTFGGVLTMMTAQNFTAVPIHQQSSPLMSFAGPMYSNLIRYNPETDDPTDIRCDLCTSWELAEDGLTYTFNLVDNARWWDGEPVLSDDVMFSFLSLTCPDCIEVMEGQLRSSSTLFKDDIDLEGSKAVDLLTVEIKTKFISAEFIAQLAVDLNKIIPEHVASKIVQTAAKPDELVGSGPFKFVSAVRDVGYELTKNEDYYKTGYPRVDGIKTFILTDSAIVMAAFATERVMLQNSAVNKLSVTQMEQLVKDNPDKITADFKGPGSLFGIMMNVTREPFDDVRVRRAIYLAIHRQPIIETLVGGKGWLGVPFPPGQWYSMTLEEAEQAPGFRELNGEKHPDDIAEAKRLLTEAGFPDGFETVMSTRSSINYTEQGILVSEQLERFLNIRAPVQEIEAAAGVAKFEAGQFEMAAQGSGLTLNTPTGAFGGRYEEGGQISRRMGGGSGEANSDRNAVAAGIQEIFLAQSIEQDPEKRKDLMGQAEQILLHEDNAYPGLWWRFVPWVYNTRVQNYNTTSNGQIQLMWEHIWCDPRC